MRRYPWSARLISHFAVFDNRFGNFMGVMLIWILLNSFILLNINRLFDPYPYILLNLVLSMLAAIQAPIILMSQNRQAFKDRLSAEHNDEVNLNASL